TDYRSEQLVRSIRLMIGRRVAGLAAIVSEMETSLIQELTDSGIPVVFYDVGTPRPNITNIRVDYRKGVEKLVSYLHSLGHQRLGFIGHHSSLGPLNDRVQSLFENVRKHSPNIAVKHVTDTDGLEGGRRAARELLRTGFSPTAILCVNDIMAVGALRELREQRLRVPLDISVTGFDNIKLSEYCDPPLTTVHIPRQTIGELVFESLVGGPENSAPEGREIMVDPELVVRESTGAVARSGTR
ncbi:MAG TPA: substrate-binding domain-containing protein, partial [Bryobacteraceae bacterium]|nr:substrate-binding domain-containing protein [Bryobacteraceae bacterium]